MTDLFERVKKIFPCFDTSEITELKIIDKKYVKYKKEGKWERVRITNFDSLREKSYHTFETLLKNLFEEVGYEFHRVPIICEKGNLIFYFPPSFRGKKTHFIEKVVYGRKLFPIFEKRYTGVKGETTTVLGLHIGEGSLIIYLGSDFVGKEGEASLDKLEEDLAKLYHISFGKRLSEDEINNLVKEYYPEIFPKVVSVIPSQPQPLQAKPEIKETVPIIAEEKREKVKAKTCKKKIEKKEVKEVREEITLEKVKEIPYDKVKEIVSSYSPPAYNFHERRAKIEYEIKISKKLDEEKRKEIDYLMCWFILSSEKTQDKAKLATDFCNQIRKL
ncbi:MAG: hypothetical protein QXQ69_01735 [Candidatus Aenigmatarchaeota archaeon]